MAYEMLWDWLGFIVLSAATVVSGLMVVFVRRQLKLQQTNSALLDLRTFHSRNFT